MKRSNVATYSQAYTEIRKLFGRLKVARDKGLSARYFSFNTPGGRCENCQGLGYVISNMLFFKDIEVICPICNGKQFKDEVLSIKYRGNSIKDILQMSVEEALFTFNDNPKIKKFQKKCKKANDKVTFYPIFGPVENRPYFQGAFHYPEKKEPLPLNSF